MPASRATNQRKSVVKFFISIFAAFALIAGSAQAGTIVLKNGDRITGDISAIWDGEVVIEPDYADEFTVDQDEIAYIESDKVFDFEFVGEDMINRKVVFKGADEQGNQIIDMDGEEQMLDIMRIGEVEEEEDFFDWSIDAALNAQIDSGNTESTELAVTTDWYLKYGKQKHFFDTLWEREEQEDPDTGEDITTKDRQRYRYNLNYELTDPWFAGAYASYETDDIKGLEYRYSATPTVGYKIWDNAGKFFNIQLGYGYEEEKTVDEFGNKEDESGTLAVMVIKFEYDFGDPDLVLYANNTTTKAQYGRDNLVNQFTGGLKYEITDLLFFNLETLVDYESEPVGGAENEDVSILIGLGLEFDK
jgi:hypothetical protein